MPLNPSARSNGDVTVAAVLAQQRLRVPQHEVRFIRPIERSVAGEQGPARELGPGRGRERGLARDAGTVGELAGPQRVIERALQRPAGTFQPSGGHLRGRDLLPHAVERTLDEGRMEVEERRDHDFRLGPRPSVRTATRSSRCGGA